jgi:hypothetical protein
MKRRECYVAVALLTERDLAIWGAVLRSVYPISPTREFDDLIRELDLAIEGQSEGEPAS